MEKTKMNHHAKMKLLLGLLVCVAVVGAFYLKTSTNALHGLNSHADELPQVHWQHATTPFALKIIDHTTTNWNNTLENITKKWSAADVINYQITPSKAPFQCYPIVMPPSDTGMHVCNINEENDWLAIAGYTQLADSPHIYYGLVVLNDFYLNNESSEYSTDAWRNKLVCEYLGWTEGLPFRLDVGDDSNSCMNLDYGFGNVHKQQYPDQIDLDSMKLIYRNHIDPIMPSSEGVTTKSTKQKVTNQSLQDGKFGRLVETINNGTTEIYQLELADGSKMNTLIQRARH